MTALATAFSVATLAVASPVYLRLLENPGAAALLRLIVVVQLAPTLALWLVDLLLARRARPSWHRVWRRALYLVAVLGFCRQAQISLRWPGAPPWISERVVVVVVLAAALILVVAAFRTLRPFFVALAPALSVWTLVVVLNIGAGPAPDPPRAASGAGAPVFVLLFDGLDPAAFMRDGRVAAEWPALRRLADQSVVFTDASTNYENTCPSVATMLTGRLLASSPPLFPGCLEVVPGLRSSNALSDLAQQRRVVVYAQALRYCFDPAFDCRGVADLQSRRPWLPLLQHWAPNSVRTGTGLDRLIGYSEHTYTLPLFDRFLEDITRAEARGRVFYLHLLLPHEPYVFEPDGAIHAPVYPVYDSDERRYVAALRAYVRQARFADRLLGRFLSRLEAQGLAEQSVIVLTSDHGLAPLEAFAAPRVVDGVEVNRSRPRAPLMVRAPDLAPATTAVQYEHVDFRRLLSALIRGDRVLFPEAPTARERMFCSGGRWYVRRDDGRWTPHGDERGHGCRAPAS